MKLYLLLISLALSSAAMDYTTANLGTTFGAATCTKTSPWSTVNIYNFQSPIAIKNSQCFPYGFFSLTMSNPGAQTFTGDGANGALTPDSYTYTGATLISDQFKWTSEDILIRRGSEHRLYIGNPDDPTADAAQADLEIQVKFSQSNGVYAFVSFLVKIFDSSASSLASNMTALAYSKASSAVNIISGYDFSGSTAQLTLDLNAVASSISAKTNAGLYLNMFTYNGTTTDQSCDLATWFVYGNYLYVDKAIVTGLDALLPTIYGAASPVITPLNTVYNYRPSSNGGGAQQAARLCFSGYFDIYLNWNYGLWFGVVIIVFFFIITLSTGESPITDPDYKEEYKTIHPWISLWVVGNELHTRKTRSSLILAIITIHCLFDSVFYRRSKNPEQPANIIVYAAYSMVISQVFICFYGIILRKYYVAKRQFLQTKDEKWNQRAQNKLFAFYSALFALIAICWPFTVWNMNELNPHRSQTSSNYWVASFFVGLGLEWLVIDFIWILLAKKINFFKTLALNRGFFYDDLCHATYMDYIKMD